MTFQRVYDLLVFKVFMSYYFYKCFWLMGTTFQNVYDIIITFTYIYGFLLLQMFSTYCFYKSLLCSAFTSIFKLLSTFVIVSSYEILL